MDGSSPRVRGKPLHRWGEVSGDGLIPACAGKTSDVNREISRDRAHPRVCGENSLGEQIGIYGAGSSPRVRGKRRGIGNSAGPRRLIPACAGKTTH